MGACPLVPVTVACLMLLYGIAGAYQPSVQASVPLLLPQESLNTGNAVINMVQTLANLLGPILGGILLSAWGLRPILWISILCFFASAVMELFIHIPHVKQPRASGVFSTVWADLRESAQYIRREKPVFLRVTLLLSAFNLILSAAMIVGIPVLVVNILKMSDASLGLTQGAMGLGGLLGGVLGGTLGNRLRPARRCTIADLFRNLSGHGPGPLAWHSAHPQLLDHHRIQPADDGGRLSVFHSAALRYPEPGGASSLGKGYRLCTGCG